MITLNDYLYSGDTVQKILLKFSEDLKKEAMETSDSIDLAEIGDANHFGYEKTQEENRTKRDIIPPGECRFFDEAYERLVKLQELELADVDVNMFKALNNQLINDGCGLFRGRQILPFEHLSRFQEDNV